MITFVEIEDGYYIAAESVIAVKKIDDNSCSLWLCGQQAEHGFVIKRNAKDLLEEICASLDEDAEVDVDKDQNET